MGFDLQWKRMRRTLLNMPKTAIEQKPLQHLIIE